jgi:Putative transposase of IS4/5 family (DUF4096)
MRTDTTRQQVARIGLRLPSDLTDAEWAVLEPLFPARSQRGRLPVWSHREIVGALLYLLRGGPPRRGCPWRLAGQRCAISPCCTPRLASEPPWAITVCKGGRFWVR